MDKCIGTTESLCCIPEINIVNQLYNTANQLYANKLLKMKKNKIK